VGHHGAEGRSEGVAGDDEVRAGPSPPTPLPGVPGRGGTVADPHPSHSNQGALAMRHLTLFACVTCALAGLSWLPAKMVAGAPYQEGDKGWVQLFNGKDLTGWKTHPKAPGKWEVKDGAIVGSGDKVS